MRKSLLLIATAVLAMTACTQDVPENEGGAIAITGEVNVSASIDEDTRTSMTTNGDNLSVSWVAGDGIGMFATDGSGSIGDNVQYTAASNEPTSKFTKVTEAIKWGEGTHNFYAYYPYADASSVTAVPISVPAVQEQSEAGNLDHLQPYAFLYAGKTGVNTSSSVVLNFKNALSVLELNLCSEAGTVLCDAIIFRADDAAEVVSTEGATIDITNGTIDTASATNSNEIKIELATPATLDATTPQSFYMMITPGHAGKRFSIYAVVNGEEVLLGNKGIPAGGLPAGVKATLNFNVPAIDLSANGTANCYILSEPSTTYKFKATVMGNGATTTGITPSALNPTTADLFWTSEYGDAGKFNSLNLAVDYKDGYVYVTTPATFRNGNAGVAAYNSLGEIVWSWHLWCVKDYDPSATSITSTKNSNVNRNAVPAVWMDRNLGALAATTPTMSGNDKLLAYGMHYQWGRKDPFGAYNSHVYMKDGGKPVQSAQSFNGAYTTTAEETFEATLAKTIKNPHLFINADASGISQWTSKTSTAAEEDKGWACLWGNPTGYAKAYGPGDVNAEQGSKSIYDPCPVGWKVPSHQMFAFITNTGEDRTGTHHWENAYKFNVREVVDNGAFMADARLSGENKSSTYPFDRTLSFYVDDCHVEGVPADPNSRLLTFMLSGSRSYGVGYLNVIGNVGIYATNAPTESGSHQGGTAFFNATTCDYYFKTIGRGNNAYQASGISVRCVRDVAAVAADNTNVVDLSAKGTANCYVVNAAGTTYKFKATVKGNGVVQSIYSKRDNTSTSWSFVEGVAGEGQTSVTLEPASADLVWYQTLCTGNYVYVKQSPINISSIKYEDGYIYFTTPNTFIDGNVVVAAKNSTGDIIWSWHLWCCEGYDVEASKKLFGTTSTGYVMDRNLGATLGSNAEKVSSAFVAAGSIGLFYQHGRKDPFTAPIDIMASDGNRGGVGCAAYDKNGNIIYGGDESAYIYNSTWDKNIISLQDKLTAPWKFHQAVEIATKYPQCKVQQGSHTSALGDSRRDWWGSRAHDSEFFYYWGHPYWQSSTNRTQKTIYDPCPVGFTIPSTDFIHTIYDNEKVYGTYGWTVQPEGRDAVFFPRTGERWGDNWKIGDVMTHGGYWSSNIGDNGCAAFIFYRSTDGTQNNFSTVFGETGSGGGEASQPINWGANGRAIRCVAEDYR